MKSAKEWHDEFCKTPPAFTGPSFFRRVQADAIRHARHLLTGHLLTDGQNLINEANRIEKGEQ